MPGTDFESYILNWLNFMGSRRSAQAFSKGFRGVLGRLIEYEGYLVLLVIPVFLFVLTMFVKEGAGFWTEFWWMFPVALGIATLVNTVGISGAAIFVPFFALVFPLLASRSLTPEQSVMLGLVTEAFGLSSSALAFIRFGVVDVKIAVSSLMGAAPMVIIFSVVSFFVPKNVILFVMSISLIISVYVLQNSKRIKAFAAEMAAKKTLTVTHEHKAPPENVTLTDRSGKTYNYCRCARKIRLIGYSVGGAFQGIAGFGIGEMGIVSMIVSGIPARVGIGTNHVLVAGTAVLASTSHLALSLSENLDVPWNIVAMTVPAVIIGGQIAPYVAARLNTVVLEKILSGIFAVLAVSLLYLAVS